MRRKIYPRYRQQDKPAQQIRDMRRNFPQFSYRMTRNEGLIWKGTLQPTLESSSYTMRIQHSIRRIPRVFVDTPQLHDDAPHRYRDGSLCLYWPEEWAWAPDKSLASTLIPWAAMWLYYYEIWMFCGKWLGPTSPHGTSMEAES